MLKILILVGIILIIYILFFKKTKTKNETKELTMIECDKCGTFISQKEAIKKKNKNFCSNECAT